MFSLILYTGFDPSHHSFGQGKSRPLDSSADLLRIKISRSQSASFSLLLLRKIIPPLQMFAGFPLSLSACSIVNNLHKTKLHPCLVNHLLQTLSLFPISTTIRILLNSPHLQRSSIISALSCSLTAATNFQKDSTVPPSRSVDEKHHLAYGSARR